MKNIRYALFIFSQVLFIIVVNPVSVDAETYEYAGKQKNLCRIYRNARKKPLVFSDIRD